MKKILVFFMCVIMAFSFSACVPKTEDSLEVGPDLSPKENVELDYVQLHNDTLELFEGYPQYSFVTDMDITGSNEEKLITVKAVCADDITEEIAVYLVSALMHRINDAAAIQDITVTASSSSGFGSLWDKYSCEISVYTETENSSESGTPFYTFSHKAGETISLDPDIEAYENEWTEQMEILSRNEE